MSLVERLASRWLLQGAGIDETLLKRIKRVENRDVAQKAKDLKALARFVRQADTAFRSLNREVSQTYRDVMKAHPPKKRPREFVKALRNDQFVKMFADTYVGPARLGTVLYALRDIRFNNKIDKAVALKKIKAAADKWYRESTLAESQAPLREILPEQMMAFLPPNIHVEVDESGQIQRMTERFRNERETVAKKIALQKALVERYNAVVLQVKKDLASSNEMVRLAALVLSIIMETGIRPGKAGNRVLEGQGDEKVEVATFGAVTLSPKHVQLVRDGFVRLEFIGKMGTVNVANLSNGAVIKLLQKYIAQAKAGGSDAVFVTEDGKKFTYSVLDSYMKRRFKFIRSTDFRKLKSTEVVLDHLYEKQQDLYAEIRGFVGEQSEDLHERVVEAIHATIQGAVLDAQTALSHKDVKETVESYLNPQVILRFLAQGRIERTLQEAVLTNQPALAFSVENFISQAMGDGIQLAASASAPLVRVVKRAAGDSLLDIMQDLESDMLDEGVTVPS